MHEANSVVLGTALWVLKNRCKREDGHCSADHAYCCDVLDTLFGGCREEVIYERRTAVLNIY